MHPLRAEVQAGLGLVEFVPKLIGGFRAPEHLRPWCSVLERVRTEAVRAACSVPVRHWKTKTTMSGLVWLHCLEPYLRFLVMTFDHERAKNWAKECRQIYSVIPELCPARGYNEIITWRNKFGGGVMTMSAAQSKLGEDVDVLIYEDPIDEQGAQDLSVRDAVDTAIAHYGSRVGRPGRPGSVVGVMSRVHIDDPIGRRLARRERMLEYIHSSAIIDEGTILERAFAPEVMTLEDIKARRAELREADPSERIFQSQWMNNPKPDNLENFPELPTYTALPQGEPYVIAVGLDLAYSAAVSSDYFALVVDFVYALDRTYHYLQHIDRMHADLAMLAHAVKGAIEAHVPVGWRRKIQYFSYMSGPEKGGAAYLSEHHGIDIQCMAARYAKIVRARRMIDACKQSRVFLPLEATWMPGVRARFRNFTGRENARDDDEIDAGVSAFDGVEGMVGMSALGSRLCFGSGMM